MELASSGHEAPVRCRMRAADGNTRLAYPFEALRLAYALAFPFPDPLHTTHLPLAGNRELGTELLNMERLSTEASAQVDGTWDPSTLL